MDASLRLARTLCDAGKLTRGAEAEQFLDLCAQNPEQIPPEFWTVRKTTDDDEQRMMRGAVLVVAAGRREEASTEPLPQSLEAVRNEPPTRVWLPVWEAVRESGWLATGLIVLALLASAAGTVFEPLLFRGFFDLARHLRLTGQRIGAIIAMICFLGALLALEWPAVTGLLRLGRHLEMRLRTRILMKIPRLHDRHFQSRLISDMAFRAHTLQLLRHLPEFAGLFVRLTASLIFAAAGIAWFYPGAALPAVLAVIVAVGVPLLFQPALASRDLRFREFSGALSRFYLDALLGLRPIQAHGAARTLRTLHSEQLGQWAEAGLRLQSVFVRAEVLQMAVTYVPVIALVYREALRTSSPAGLLLLAYWAVSIPTLGQELASIAWDMPALRNTLWRLLEPLGAPEEETPQVATATAKTCGVGVEIEKVTVVAGGHVILENLDLSIAPGEHIAVVGLSGAGKSSLASLLLGWHKPQSGSVTVDGAPLDAERLSQLRRHTAWIAPEVHLFQASLLDNLNYGNGSDSTGRVGLAIQGTDLLGVSGTPTRWLADCAGRKRRAGLRWRRAECSDRACHGAPRCSPGNSRRTRARPGSRSAAQFAGESAPALRQGNDDLRHARCPRHPRLPARLGGRAGTDYRTGLAARVVREDRFSVPHVVRSRDDYSPALMVWIDLAALEDEQWSSQ